MLRRNLLAMQELDRQPRLTSQVTARIDTQGDAAEIARSTQKTPAQRVFTIAEPALRLTNIL